MRTASHMVGRGDGDGLGVGGEEDSGEAGVGVLVGVASELSKSDERGVAGVGVSGGDKRDECLGDKEMSSSMFPSGSKDKARAVI